MAEKGVFLRIGGLLPTGDWKDVALKAWSAIPGEPPKWELRRLAPACGYDNCKLRDLAKGQSTATRLWQSWSADVGLEWNMHYGASAASASQAAAAVQNPEPAKAEQEYWLSTPGMLGMLLFWHSYRRESGHRQRVQAVSQWALQETVSPEIDFQLQRIPADLAQRCQGEPDADGMCKCAQEYVPECSASFYQRCSAVGTSQHALCEQSLCLLGPTSWSEAGADRQAYR